MPRTPSENESIRRASKQQILEATMDLFCSKGYHSTSIDDVAKRAQISKGLLYHYFKGKEELLAAIVDLRINDILIVMEAAKAKETPAEQIRHIIEGALEDKPEIFRFYLNLFTQPRLDPIVAKYGQKLMDEQIRQFEVQTQMFVNLGVANPRERSLYFSSTIQGIMLMYSTYPQTFPLEEVKAIAIAQFCSNG
ncbi:TetR family transcriptional regulator [Scytonema sp. UIC 10036]|uniref:TetR/AcrR family transcriptional regulator n=1 Tax=Scytonema sp. UIC 10036 TaxID=2304196 RepID=UPI0012DA7B55|nr:TetR/AcrR family transcriptional regulator [Scytonema sp. UIC 10036]MUG91007.1 TetR family transcriptional regulator [Scytonema sp. UIC 10036]